MRELTMERKIPGDWLSVMSIEEGIGRRVQARWSCSSRCYASGMFFLISRTTFALMAVSLVASIQEGCCFKQ